MCPKCHIRFGHRKPICIKKQWLIFKWEQYFCWNCGIRLILTTGPTNLGHAYWQIPLFVIKRKQKLNDG